MCVCFEYNRSPQRKISTIPLSPNTFDSVRHKEKATLGLRNLQVLAHVVRSRTTEQLGASLKPWDGMWSRRAARSPSQTWIYRKHGGSGSEWLGSTYPQSLLSWLIWSTTTLSWIWYKETADETADAHSSGSPPRAAVRSSTHSVNISITLRWRKASVCSRCGKANLS